MKLTSRGRAVLRGLALGQSAPELTPELSISALTVETHRRNLRHRLGATTGCELVRFAQVFVLIQDLRTC